MRTYHVKEGDKVQATLYYWEDTDEYQLVLTEDSTLVPYYDGVLGKVIPKSETKAWVRDRVIPPERDNIMEILSGIGHTDYKEIYFIDAIQGKCVCGTRTISYQSRKGYEACFAVTLLVVGSVCCITALHRAIEPDELS